MVVHLQDYAMEPVLVLQRTYSFLGLEQVDAFELEQYVKQSSIKNANKNGYEKFGDMLNKTRQLLSDFYRPYNVKLSTLLKDVIK